MSEEINSIQTVTKLLGIGLLTVGANHLIFRYLLPQLTASSQEIQNPIIDDKKWAQNLKHRKKYLLDDPQQKQDTWGSLKFAIEDESEDPLLTELQLMDSLLCSLQRVNNLIVDLKMANPRTISCPLVKKGMEGQKRQQYLSPSSLVNPGQFIISQCVFRPGTTVDMDKKYLRAGPRGTQFFKPEQVNADIVCLGNVCPGMNTAVRELVLILKNQYQVPRVMGVQNSFRGYYDKKFIQLTPEMVQTVHHRGGCFLGLSKSELLAGKIVDNLVERKVNQVYLIGANKTLRACKKLYEEIKRRELPIAICVILKGINRDVPIFDTCFGFETAVEESSRILLCAYNLAKSYGNGVSLVKLPGIESGFLACYAALSSINVNICLVPEFPFDLHGDNGVISYVCKRIQSKKSCTIVYSEGAMNSARDYYSREENNCNSCDATSNFDSFFKNEIEKALLKEKLNPYHVSFFNGVELARSVPTNSIDTKLCCQNAHASIFGLMCGYTNFACGHLANKNAMISVHDLIESESTTKLKEFDHGWQRLTAITGQPSSFLNVGEGGSSSE